MLIDDSTARRDTLRRAIESSIAATELKPDFWPAWHNLGHAYYDSGRLLVEAENALEKSNELPDASLDARVEFFSDSAVATYMNSLKVLDVAVKLMPDAAAVHNSRGRTLVALHRDEEASNEFKIAAEIDPSNQMRWPYRWVNPQNGPSGSSSGTWNLGWNFGRSLLGFQGLMIRGLPGTLQCRNRP